MASSFNQVTIGAADRKDDVIRVELWRTVSSVGLWMALLRNTGGVYNGVFDVQDAFRVDVNGVNTLMEGRLDGPECVTLRGRDLESDWDEYAIMRGVDQAQDLLFHNDFEYFYPDTTQTLYDVWDDVINTQLLGLTNITFVKPVPDLSPVVGAMEFREGTSFLAATQELFRRAGYLFYVDDSLAFQSGAPGWSAAGGVLQSVAGALNNNILDIVDLSERDGDKHYNYIRFYGKNPMFDGYTEYNVIGAPWLVGWHPWQLVLAGQMANDTATVMVGTYSIVAWNNNPVNQHIRLYYTLPYYNYTGFDFTKGELGVWALYDDTLGAPGTPGAGSMGAGPVNLFVRLTDGAARTADYYGTSTVLYRGDWGYCTFPIGEGGQSVAFVANQWFLSNPAFNWANIVEMYFSVRPAGGFAAANYPSHVYLDGISMPEPCIAVSDGVTGVMTNGTGTVVGSPLTLVRGLNQPTITVAGTFTIDLSCATDGIAASNGWVVQGSPVTLNPGSNTITVLGGGAGVIDVTLNAHYRRRPYVDYWQHIRTQTALDAKATQFLTQHQCTAIDKLKLVTEGNLALRYAGQSTTVNIPSLGLNNSLMYMTQIHHIIEPYSDVSGGFAFDFISEVELVPINGIGYDMSRLRVGSVYSPTQLGSRVGTGVRVK